jgi:heme/copper-type cytochrome/quinol oxidase subunit 1
LRAPGLALRFVPVFSWSVLVAAVVLLLATPVLLAGLVLLFVDRHYGGHVLDASRRGDPAAWRHLFWFFAHPATWALVLPALGAVTQVFGVFGRRARSIHRPATNLLAGVGVLSFAGFAVELAGEKGMSRPVASVGGVLVFLPVLGLVGLWLAGLRARPSLTTPLLHGVGTLTTVLVAVAGGIVLAVAPTGARTGVGTYWGVAELHELLFGVSAVGAFVALYHWGPKLWGRHLSEGLGMLELLVLLLGVHLAFLPMFVLGLQRMRAHVSGYGGRGHLGPANLVSTIGTYLIVLAVLLLLVNVVVSVVARRGRSAGDDPWTGDSLEWATTSPPPPHNFETLPEVRSERPLADLASAPGAAS